MTPFTKVVPLSSVDLMLLSKIQQALYGLAQLCLVVSYLLSTHGPPQNPGHLFGLSASRISTDSMLLVIFSDKPSFFVVTALCVLTKANTNNELSS